jgi:uncharacterized protein (UPF0303 family)
MKDVSSALQAAAREEETLRFPAFNAQAALEIGQLLIRRARADGAPILIRIRAFGMTLFEYAFDGVTPDNLRWMRRKANITELYRRSSYAMQLQVEAGGKPMAEALSLDPMEYDASGGCFPIRLTSGEMVGHISVSGYATPAGDHQAIVNVLQQYL